MLRLRASRQIDVERGSRGSRGSRGTKADAGLPTARLAAALAAALSLCVPAGASAEPLGRRALSLALWRQAAPAAPTAPTAPAPSPPAAPSGEATAAELSIASWAGAATATSLADLLASAIRTAPELALARLDAEIAEGRIDEAAAIDDWQLAAAAEASRATLSGTTQLDLSASLSRVLGTGGTLSLAAGSTVADTETSIGGVTASGTTWTDSLTASLNQPLLRGRGNALTYANLRRSELVRDSTQLSRQVSAIAIVQAIVASYWDLVLSEQEVAIAQASLELAEERLRLTRAGIRGGKVADAEALAVEQAIATRTEEVLGAELAIVDRSIALRRQAGLPIAAGSLALRVDSAVGPGDRQWQLAALLDAAYAASPELARLAVDEKTVELDVEVTKNGLLPQLDLALSLSSIGFDDTAGGALGNLATVEDYRVAATLSFQQSLGARAAAGRLRAARGQLERVKVTAADIKQQLAQSLTRAVGQLELARRRAQLAQRAIDLSQRNIEVELTRFGLGKSTNFDVLQRQDELKQARLRYARALIDWRKSETAVMALTGELLPFYGIELGK